jgi:hypothetical protein
LKYSHYSKAPLAIATLMVSMSVLAHPANAGVASGTYRSLLQGLVYSGITDAETLNHNIGVYRLILARIQAYAQIDPAHSSKEESLDSQKQILALVADVQSRLQAQLEYVPEPMVAGVLGEVWTELEQAKRAASRFDFKSVGALTRAASTELEQSKVN